MEVSYQLCALQSGFSPSAFGFCMHVKTWLFVYFSSLYTDYYFLKFWYISFVGPGNDGIFEESGVWVNTRIILKIWHLWFVMEIQLPFGKISFPPSFFFDIVALKGWTIFLSARAPVCLDCVFVFFFFLVPRIVELLSRN